MTKKQSIKRQSAVALKYNQTTDEAPIVVAKGQGLIAEQIIERATENNIPIQEDPTLISLLGQLDINETIPDELYQAVAEVFAFIYQLDENTELSNAKYDNRVDRNEGF